VFSAVRQSLASDEAIKKLRASLPDVIFAATVYSESFPDSSRAGIVERHVVCAYSPMHLAESDAPSNSSQLQSSITFGAKTNKQFQFVCKTLALTLHYRFTVTSLSCQADIAFC